MRAHRPFAAYRRVAQRTASRLAAVTLLVATPATAKRPQIEWHAPPGCGTTPELRQAIDDLLARESADSVYERFVADAHEQSEGRWELRLQAFSTSENWTRSLLGASCDELRDAAKVMIALAIDPSLEASFSQRLADENAKVTAASPPSAAANVPPSALSTASAPPSAQLTDPRNLAVAAPPQTNPPQYSPKDWAKSDASALEPQLALLARVGVATGILPKPSLTLSIGVERGGAHWQLSGRVGWMLPQAIYRDPEARKGAKISHGFATAELGYAWLEAPLELGIHCGITLGAVIGTGVGLADGTTKLGPWSSAGGGFSIAYPANHRWAAVLSADGWAAYWSPQFTIRELGVVHQSELFGAACGLGARARFD